MSPKSINLFLMLCLLGLCMSQTENPPGPAPGQPRLGRTTNGGGTYECILKCNGDQACVDSCTLTGILVGSIIGGVFGLAAIVLAICCVLRSKGGLLKRFPCHTYQTLKRAYNVTTNHELSKQQYIFKRDALLKLLNNNQARKFTETHVRREEEITNLVATVEDQADFQTHVRMTGRDKLGTWSALGYILAREGGLFMWFYKEYDDREQANQTGELSHLVFEGRSVSVKEGVEGRWFFVGFEGSESWSGSWTIRINKDYKENSNMQVTEAVLR